MKKLREARNTVQQAESLIELLKEELDETRNFLYRMYLEHGTKLKDGVIDVPSSVGFGLDEINNLRVIDLTGGFPTTTYQYILNRIEELK